MDLGHPPSTLIAWLEFVAKLGGAATAIYLLLRYGRDALAGVVRWWRDTMAIGTALRALPTVIPSMGRIEGIEQSLASVLREVRPNGGSSMRDELRRMGDTVRQTQAGLTVLANTQRVMFDAGETAVFECTAEEGNTYVNHVYQRWTGLTEAQLLGFGWVNAIALPDRAAVREEWDEAVEDEREFRMAYRLLDRDGKPIDVFAHASPVRGMDGELLKWVGVVYRHDPAIDGARHA